MNSPMILTYPGLIKNDSLRALSLPDPKHFLFKKNTGNNATVLIDKTTFNGSVVSDSSEIGAFTASGKLVGGGMVVKGITCFPVWGNSLYMKEKEGCDILDELYLRLWNGKKEYPLDFKTKKQMKYIENGIFTGTCSVPLKYFITRFNLSGIHYNPIRKNLKISFDVTMDESVNEQKVEISMYSTQGRFIAQLVKSKYQAGRYTVNWSAKSAYLTSNIFIVQMKAGNFKKAVQVFF
jgi:hypothetical protein